MNVNTERRHRRAKHTSDENHVRHLFLMRRTARACDRDALLWLAIALAFVVAGGVAASLAPLALKNLVDHITVTGSAGSLPHKLEYLVALYVGALLFQRVCEQIQAYAYVRGEQRLIRRFGTESYAHMLALPLAVHFEKRSGALTQSLSQGVLGLRLILTHMTLTVAPIVVQFVVAGAVLSGLLGTTLGLLLLCGLIAYSAVFAFGIARLRGPLKRLSAFQVDAGGIASDGLMNVEAIKAYTAEGRFSMRYDELLGATEQSWKQFARRRLDNGFAVSLVFGGLLTVTLVVAGQDTASGHLSVGSFVLINAYILQLVRPIELLGFAIRDIGQGAAYLKDIGVLLATAAEFNEVPPPTLPPHSHPAELSFEHVRFGFGQRATVDDVSFTAAPGRMIGIVGPSGAGKSSLLRLILRFYEPWSGRILLDGVPLGDLPLNALRGQIALVSQDTILFNDTIDANIRFGADQAEENEVIAAAASANLTALLADLPEGLNTLVGERGLKLSGGEKQRVSIARAALKRARLVIFDEATAALDPATERAVWKAMHGLAQGVTTLVVTHRLTTVSGADQILVLDHGKVVERGTHTELLAQKALYCLLWQAQEKAPQNDD